MAYSKQLRASLRADYIGGLSLAQAAERYQAPIETARRWKARARDQGDDWDNLRRAALVLGKGREQDAREILDQFQAVFRATLAEIKAAKEMDPAVKVKSLASLSDSFNKTVSAFGQLHPQVSRLGIAMEVLEMLTAYIRRNHPQTFEAYLEILEPFGRTLADRYG